MIRERSTVWHGPPGRGNTTTPHLGISLERFPCRTCYRLRGVTLRLIDDVMPWLVGQAAHTHIHAHPPNHPRTHQHTRKHAHTPTRMHTHSYTYSYTHTYTHECTKAPRMHTHTRTNTQTIGIDWHTQKRHKQPDVHFSQGCRQMQKVRGQEHILSSADMDAKAIKALPQIPKHTHMQTSTPEGQNGLDGS